MSVLAVASSTCNASSTDHSDGCAWPTYEANAMPQHYTQSYLLTTVAAVGAQLLQATLMVAHGSLHAFTRRLAARVFLYVRAGGRLVHL